MWSWQRVAKKKRSRRCLAAFPHLQVDDHEIVTRFRDPETKKALIDVIKPNQPLFREA